MDKILYLEDDLVIHEAVAEYLKHNNYDITSAYDGNEALAYAKKNNYDLFIFDIMVPHKTGLEVLEELIKNNIIVPTIMLSAIDDENTQVASFDLYVADYVTKPFSNKVLLKRIEAVLRRSNNNSKVGLTLLKKSFEVFYNNEKIDLTYSEYLIFEKLYENQNYTFTREMLLGLVLDDKDVNDRLIDAHIKNLRKKIPVACLKTIRGVGYKFEITD